MTDRFKLFFNELMKNEGIESNDPHDSGGHTIYGISRNNFPKDFDLVYSLYYSGKIQLAKDAAMKFYYKNFWEPDWDLIEDSSLAFRLFDASVNMGKATARRLLDEIIRKYYSWCNCTGGFINRFNNVMPGEYSRTKLPDDYKQIVGETHLYSLYVWRIEKYYRSLKNFWKFGKGWLRRVNRVFNGAPDLYKPLSPEIRGVETIKPDTREHNNVKVAERLEAGNPNKPITLDR